MIFSILLKSGPLHSKSFSDAHGKPFLDAQYNSTERYDLIIIPFKDLETHAPAGQQPGTTKGIILHAPTESSVFTTLSVLQNRSVGCHYIVPQHTLHQLQEEAKFLLAQQEYLPESEKLSPVALNACRVIMAFQGKKIASPSCNWPQIICTLNKQELANGKIGHVMPMVS